MRSVIIVKPLGFVCLFLPILFYLLKKSFYESVDYSTHSHKSVDVLSPNPLDGCLHVYLDMGTNTGVQIRKLFEAHKFPAAWVLPIFDKYFGPVEERDSSTVCAVGFEPNPDHEPNLNFLSSLYNACGWRTIIHTQTGVASKNMDTQFARIDYARGSYWGFGVAGRLVDKGVPLNDTTEVKAVRIAEYINKIVATRSIPENANGKYAAVVMKLDVEGRELELLADLVMSGALEHLDNVHVDWSTDEYSPPSEDIEKMRQAIGFITKIAKEKNLTHIADIEETDDESFASFTGDFPQC